MRVEIGQYTECSSGALVGMFSLVLHDFGQMKVHGCKHFVKGESSWFKLPDKEGKSKDGSQVKWYPIIMFCDPDIREEIESSVMTALKAYKKKVPHVDIQPAQEELFPGEPSLPW